MSIDLTNPRIRQRGNDYEVLVDRRWYLVEEDDRDQPPLWKAYTDDQGSAGGERIGQTDDPLAGNEAVCAAHTSAASLIDVLLAAGVR